MPKSYRNGKARDLKIRDRFRFQSANQFDQSSGTIYVVTGFAHHQRAICVEVEGTVLGETKHYMTLDDTLIVIVEET